MEEFVREIETKKIDRISQQKRLLFYYYFLQKMGQKSLDEVWNEYEKILHSTENWRKYYEDFFENQSINDEEETVNFYCLVTDTKDTSSQNTLKNIWRKIKDVIKKEIDCEKKLYDILENKGKEHPIISRFILTILIGILVGLVEDCIHDAIQMNYEQSKVPVINIYVTDENNKYTQILYKGDNIVVEEVTQDQE